MGHRDRVLAIVRTDSTFSRMQQRDRPVWSGKCIHCNSRLVVADNGDTDATIEHIMPLNLGGTDDLGNVALACKRCNNLKGKRMDWRGAGDVRLQDLVATLTQKRRKRWRDG